MSFFRSNDRSGVTPIHLLSNLISRKPDISIGFFIPTPPVARASRLQCAKSPAALVQKRAQPREKTDRCNRKLDVRPA